MRVTIDRRGLVNAEGALDLPVSAVTAWGQMRDWRRFLTIDPLHVRIDMVRPPTNAATPVGARFVIRHRLLRFGPDRVGRVLTWKEGQGYAISDLSRRGVKRGFPHVCTYTVRSTGPASCRIILGARGRWTARWMPRALARAWIWWVLRATESRVQGEFLALHAWRTRAGRARRAT